VLWLTALIALGLGGCQQARDGGPHPEPPARIPSDDRDGGMQGHAGEGGSAGAGTGASGGMGGAGSGGSGSGGMDHAPPCEEDAGFEDEDAGPLR